MGDARVGKFTYTPLQDPHSTIRALRILASSTSQLIKLSIEVIPVTGKYKCLSYTWGVGRAQHRIAIDDQTFWVRDNLHDFLIEARRRNPNGSGHIWIDAISINQDDIPEKNVQVAMMGDIYKNALRVVAWLGQGDEAMHNTFKFMASKVNTGKYTISDASQREKAAQRMTKNASQKEFWDTFDSLGSALYFSRMWIVQEIVLAREYVLWCGQLGLASQHVEDLWTYISETPGPGGDNELAFQKSEGSPFAYLWNRRARSSRTISFGHGFKLFAGNGCHNPMDKIFALRSLDPTLSDLPVYYDRRPVDLVPQLYERINAGDAGLHLGLSVIEELGTNPLDLFHATKDALPAHSWSLRFQDVGVIEAVAQDHEASIDWDVITVPGRDIAVYSHDIESVQIRDCTKRYCLQEGDVVARSGAQLVMFIFRSHSSEMSTTHLAKVVDDLHEVTQEHNLANKENLKPLNQALRSYKLLCVCQIAHEHQPRVTYEALDEVESDVTGPLILEPITLDADMTEAFADARLYADNVHIRMSLDWNRMVSIWRVCWKNGLFIVPVEEPVLSWDEEMQKKEADKSNLRPK
jgi:hypothetical protein